jgi:hypothetical protein
VGNNLTCGETELGSWTGVFGTGDGIMEGAAMVGMTARSAVVFESVRSEVCGQGDNVWLWRMSSMEKIADILESIVPICSGYCIAYRRVHLCCPSSVTWFRAEKSLREWFRKQEQTIVGVQFSLSKFIHLCYLGGRF